MSMKNYLAVYQGGLAVRQLEVDFKELSDDKAKQNVMRSAHHHFPVYYNVALYIVEEPGSDNAHTLIAEYRIKVVAEEL